jgi:hypothetical protein
MSTSTFDALDLGEAAQDYAARGWPVQPLHSWTGDRCSCGRPDCTSPAKHPRLRHGLNEATTDVEVVGGWWDRWPRSNIGLRTGVAFDVLDVDPAGTRSLVDLIDTYAPLLARPVAYTGRGDHHYFAVTGNGNRAGGRAGTPAGLDWRGSGGFVVAPPSIHCNGSRYDWAIPPGTPDDLPPAPAWLLNVMFSELPATVSRSESVANDVCQSAGHLAKYCRRALESECGRIALANEGHRNDQLNASAYNLGRLIGPDLLSAEDVAGSLLIAALRAGLEQREAEATIQSGIRAGIQRPRRSSA